MKKLNVILPVMLALLFVAEPAFAQDAAGAGKGYLGLGAGLAIGLAVIGGASARATLPAVSTRASAATRTPPAS